MPSILVAEMLPLNRALYMKKVWWVACWLQLFVMFVFASGSDPSRFLQAIECGPVLKSF